MGEYVHAVDKAGFARRNCWRPKHSFAKSPGWKQFLIRCVGAVRKVGGSQSCARRSPVANTQPHQRGEHAS